MPERRRLVFISAVAVPQQIGFGNALQEYFDARNWFYEWPDRTRAPWWRVDMGPYSKVLHPVWFPKSGPLQERYVAPTLRRELDAFDPDVVMLGSFSYPSNYLAYRWARRHGKKTVVLTERSRDAHGVLRRRGVAWRLLRWLYRDVDLVVVMADDAVGQFRDEFRFGDKVVAGRYAADLEPHLEHPLRQRKEAYTFLFANRATAVYNPLGAIDIFARVLARYPGSRLLMNSAGEQIPDCRARVEALGIADAVEFLGDFKSWDELHTAYARSDILLLPATFSNGNWTILEAMASGMGIVISDRVLGVGKMVEDGVNGFRCEPTVEAFLDRIERYIGDPELFSRHAEINRPLVLPLSATGTAKFFAELLNRRLWP